LNGPFSYRHCVSIRLKKIRDSTVSLKAVGSSPPDANSSQSDRPPPSSPHKHAVEGLGCEEMESAEGLFRCHLCAAAFGTEEKRICHVNETHAASSAAVKDRGGGGGGGGGGAAGGGERFQCEICLQKFQRRSVYVAHRKEHGKGELDADMKIH
jgi:uncharacterized C2H2 Zn-finger protein